MPQILSTTTNLPTETVGYEAPNGYDGQGMTAYATSVDVEANVVEYDMASKDGAQFVTNPDGSLSRIALTLYVRGDSAVVPAEEGRITLSDARKFIIKDRRAVSGLRYSRLLPDHYRYLCAVE